MKIVPNETPIAQGSRFLGAFSWLAFFPGVKNIEDFFYGVWSDAFFFPEIVFYSSSIKKVLDDLREVTMSELLLPAGYEGYQDPIWDEVNTKDSICQLAF